MTHPIDSIDKTPDSATAATGPIRLLRQIEPLPGFVPFTEDVGRTSFVERFERQVAQGGDRLAVKGRASTYTYASLDRAANRLGHALLRAAGPAPEPVALMFTHDAQAIAALVGVLKAGKFYVVLDPDYPAERLRSTLADSGARIVVADARHRDRAHALAAGHAQVIAFEEAIGSAPGDERPEAAVGPDSAAFILYTSGSTGRAKGALHTHRSVLADARNLTNGWGVVAADRWLLASSLGFANSVRTVYTALANGASIHPFDVKADGFVALATFLVDRRITIIRAVPTFFRSFIATLDGAARFPDVRVLSVGGEPMLRADLAGFNRHFAPHCVLSHAFGPTECLTVCWALIPHGTPPGEGKLPIGRPLPDKEVLLLDESHREVADGEVGEIAVRSTLIASGYWRDPARTSAAFLPDPAGSPARVYLTGDLGKRDAEGCLVHQGRRDFQVKIRGFRVDVIEIEGAMRAVAGVADAVVASREAQPGDARLVAYYVPLPGDDGIETRLRETLARKLPDFMVPSLFVAIDAIPRTPTGKTDRLGLPAVDFARPTGLPPASRVLSATEAELACIWAEVLGVPHVGADDDFLRLGGTSLQAAMIGARATARWGSEVGVRAVLEARTVARLAHWLARAPSRDAAATGGIPARRTRAGPSS